MVLTSDPGLALLLDTNPEIAHLLVAAHVFGHVDCFTNNLCCADTHRRMVHNAVAHLMDIGGVGEQTMIRSPRVHAC
ncbi:MAG: SpoVR family protein [Planctomycetota bacterium]|nr:MAG: SpoVR family protein [Planctomycetota bacterium]